MRWYFTDWELAQDDDIGKLVRALFEHMRPQLEYDVVGQRWIMKRKEHNHGSL